MKRRKEDLSMEWLEANPLPVVCENCEEEDCYNCDHAGERWYLSERDELLLQKKAKEQAIRRLQRQIQEIDNKLAALENNEKAASN